MSEELNQDKYTIDLMKTLWENTFRGTIFDYKNQYIATVRIVFNIPLDRDLVPDNAPEVSPAIIVLVEDTIISPIDVVSFEQTITPILVKKLTSRYFQPDRVCSSTQARQKVLKPKNVKQLPSIIKKTDLRFF